MTTLEIAGKCKASKVIKGRANLDIQSLAKR
jgi:hypothetical protein